METVKKYIWNLFIAVDQFINTILGGDPDETLSSRMGKWSRDHDNDYGWRKPVFKVANFVVELFEKDHFAKSIEEDQGNDKIIE